MIRRGVWIEWSSESADLINPQFAHDNVVHSGGHLTPHVVVPARMELQVDGT